MSAIIDANVEVNEGLLRKFEQVSSAERDDQLELLSLVLHERAIQSLTAQICNLHSLIAAPMLVDNAAEEATRIMTNIHSTVSVYYQQYNMPTLDDWRAEARAAAGSACGRSTKARPAPA